MTIALVKKFANSLKNDKLFWSLLKVADFFLSRGGFNHKRFCSNFLLRNNIWLSKTSAPQDLNAFFDLIKPIKTNFPLIRIGGDNDGGYLIPDDLVGVEICFSPGVSVLADFENDLTKMGVKCFLADYSVEKPPIENEKFYFTKKYLGSKNNDIFMTLESWVNLNAANKNELILQMDIEGSEYPVLMETPLNILSKFRIIVIEFHDLDNLFNTSGLNQIKYTFEKLLEVFEIVHIHPNNCAPPFVVNGFNIPPVMEFTFLNRNRIESSERNYDFPNKLDGANVIANADFPLPMCWYKN